MGDSNPGRGAVVGPRSRCCGLPPWGCYPTGMKVPSQCAIPGDSYISKYINKSMGCSHRPEPCQVCACGPSDRKGAGRNLRVSNVSKSRFRPRHSLCAYPRVRHGARIGKYGGPTADSAIVRGAVVTIATGVPTAGGDGQTARDRGNVSETGMRSTVHAKVRRNPLRSIHAPHCACPGLSGSFTLDSRPDRLGIRPPAGLTTCGRAGLDRPRAAPRDRARPEMIRSPLSNSNQNNALCAP
jgi:hypothetical protein